MSVPEVRRLLAALGASSEEQRLRLHWSTFRRRHQATSKRLHALRRARQAPCPPAQLPAPVPLCGLPPLTEADWQRITPLLPPQTPQRGRRAADYHRMVEGMLWIVHTGSSWRELPERFGPWETVAYHFYRWGKVGLWQRIREVLLQERALPGPAP
ncbi:transposase [Ktedonobacter racemifer]|uniref:transposase n=1 Tax=Ktedonobacter racemifer TaxID=363277 RepID=UPI000697CE5E|nr:transposase [Ktedonobacter racemifer]